MQQAQLKIQSGKHQGKLIALGTRRFLVGREQDCHLRPNSDLVSRHHCVFISDEYSIRVRDLGSTNGTRVNGELIRGEVVLNHGDKVIIGRLELEVQIREVAEVTAPEAAPVPAPAVTGPSNVERAPTAEMPLVAESASAIETSYEVPAYTGTEDTALGFSAEQANLAAGQQAEVPAAPAYPPQNYASGYPAAAPVGGYPGYPAGYGQPGYGAPAYQTGYPQPGFAPAGYGMPGYAPAYPAVPAYPAGYPAAYPQAGGYPMGMAVASPAAPAPAPAAAAPALAPEAAPAAEEDPLADVRLPDPASTGLRTTPVGSGGAPTPGAGPAPEKPSNTAADIIKQYMQKRTR